MVSKKKSYHTKLESLEKARKAKAMKNEQDEVEPKPSGIPSGNENNRKLATRLPVSKKKINQARLKNLEKARRAKAMKNAESIEKR
ncbi:unnamed protein product [Caenorhabditis angaria]|uniref:Uncharacterized protein n=1 Tax=Caenorhabditis angaria TaxID=860376 RepID=A0A9P1IF11_9PELO|nr:unnamed protein product [Caenorhabditis angaria]